MTFTHVYTLLCKMKRSTAQRLHVYTCTYRDYNNILLLYRDTYKYRK